MKKCLSEEKAVVSFSKLFHLLMVVVFLMLGALLCFTYNFRFMQVFLGQKMQVR